jgi:hypothetical protein
MLRNIAEERRRHSCLGGSLKSRVVMRLFAPDGLPIARRFFSASGVNTVRCWCAICTIPRLHHVVDLVLTAV